MTKEERAEDLEKTRLSMGLLPIDIVRDMRKRDRGKPKRPYMSLDDEAAALALQVAVPDPIEIDDGNDNDNHDLFSTDSNDDNGNNDPNDDNDPDDN